MIQNNNQSKLDYLHVLCWLIKDLCWCLVCKPLGIFMIFPTLFVSLFITKKSSKTSIDFYTNLAITFWIIANSIWMLTEFFEMDTRPMFSIFVYKHLAIIPFIIGLIVLIFYFIKRKKTKNLEA